MFTLPPALITVYCKTRLRRADTNSRLCMASSVASHERAFGEDVVAGVYTDFEEADLVVLIGSNLAWCHPVLHQRLLAARERRGTRIVVTYPHTTATSAAADLHLPLAPGSDVALFNGLLRRLHRSSAAAVDYVARHTHGYAAAARAAQPFDLRQGVPPDRACAGRPRPRRGARAGASSPECSSHRASSQVACSCPCTGRRGMPAGASSTASCRR